MTAWKVLQAQAIRQLNVIFVSHLKAGIAVHDLYQATGIVDMPRSGTLRKGMATLL